MAYQIRPSAKKYKRTHAQLVAECANQVAGVFAYYADTTLTNEQVAQICSALDKILPKDFTTEG